MILIETIFWLSAFSVIYTYMIYPILLLVLKYLRKPLKLKKSEDGRPGVSIVIAAYNEEKVIRGRIENCLSIDYPVDKLEIIIASDGSDDKTSEICQEYVSKGIHFFDYKERRGKVNVLNETVPKAKHDIIVFSDANTMFKRDAIRLLVSHFADERVGCVCGGLHFVNASGSRTGELEGAYWRYETFLKKMEGRWGSLLGANGAIFGLRKELFYQCPGDTIIEDFMVPMKILEQGHYVIYDPHACAVEEAGHKIVHEKERRVRIGAGDFQALSRLKSMLHPSKGFSALAFLSHKVLRWFAPFFLIIAFVFNVFLIGYQPYAMILALQVTFYLLAVVGRILSRRRIHHRFLNLCYYFVSMNYALLLGFFRYIKGQQKVAWQRTER